MSESENSIETLRQILSRQIGDAPESTNRLPSYADQNFLVDFIGEFDKLKGSSLTQNYKNFIMMEPEWQSSLFLNELTKIGKGQSLLENIPRSLLGDLQPYFKLFLTEGMKKGQYKQVRLPLNNTRDKDGRPFDYITRDRKGLRVGFRSFSWDYLGSHPGDIDYNINCKLKLYFESPHALFHEYTTPKNDTYGFYNLIYRRGPTDKGSKFASEHKPSIGGSPQTHETHLDYHQKDFRIKIEIGYIPPKKERIVDAFIEQGLSGGGAIRAASDFREALTANKIELYLTLVKHTFVPIFSSSDFGFELDIEFVGSVEQAFISDDANILIRKNAEQERTLNMLEDKVQKIRQIKNQAAHLRPDIQEAVEELDLDVIKAEIVANEGDPDDLDQVKNQISTSLNNILSTNQVRPNNVKIEPDHLDKFYDYLKATSEKGNYEYKLLLSPTNKYDLYRRIICNLNESGKIYNLKIPSDDFTDYINKRGELQEGVSLSPEEISALEEKLDNTNDKSEKMKTRKILRDAKIGAINKKAPISNFKEKIFKDNKTKLGSNKQEINDKIKKALTDQLQSEFGLNRADIDPVEYQKYISNSMDKKEAERTTEDNTHYLHWFYYGDLLDSVVDTLKKREDLLDLDMWSEDHKTGLLKIVLGNVEYVDHVTGENKLINIAKVPISLDLWEEFWHKYVVSDFKSIYYFKSFLRDSFTYLVKSSLTNRSKLPGDAVIRMIPGVDYIDIPTKEFNSKFFIRPGKNKDRSHYLKRKDNSNNLLLSDEDADSYDPISGEDTQRILYMFDMSNKPGYLIGGDKTEDNSYGVYHLIPGQYNTPIQQISFTKTDQPLWLEAKAYNSDYLRKNVHYSEPYNCNFTIFGNTLIRPGRHIYIRFPYSWFGHPLQPSAARALGLGGYFFMTKTSNTVLLSPGGGRLEWNTTAQALWTERGGTKKKPTPNVIKEFPPSPGEEESPDPDQSSLPPEKPSSDSPTQGRAIPLPAPIAPTPGAGAASFAAVPDGNGVT